MAKPVTSDLGCPTPTTNSDLALPVLMTVGETAALLRKTPKAIYAMAERGLLPGVTRIGRRLLVRSADLLRWLDQKRAPETWVTLCPRGGGVPWKECHVMDERPLFCGPLRPELRFEISGQSAAIFADVVSGEARLIYAVDLMVVLRCTQQLLFRLKRFDDAPAVRSTTRLGDWYGNLLRMGNRHALLFISERSRLPVLIPVREANRLRMAFPHAVCLALGTVGVPADAIEQEHAHMSEIAFGRTSSRSLRGSLTDFSFLARTRFLTARDEPLEKIARDLAETPLIAPFDGARPSAVTRKLFGAG